jgi:hypothetical protein
MERTRNEMSYPVEDIDKLEEAVIKNQKRLRIESGSSSSAALCN